MGLRDHDIGQHGKLGDGHRRGHRISHRRADHHRQPSTQRAGRGRRDGQWPIRAERTITSVRQSRASSAPRAGFAIFDRGADDDNRVALGGHRSAVHHRSGWRGLTDVHNPAADQPADLHATNLDHSTAHRAVPTSPLPTVPATSPPTTTASPIIGTIDGLIAKLAPNADAYGDRGSNLLDKLRSLQAERSQYSDTDPHVTGSASDLIDDVHKWLGEGRLNPTIGADALRLLAPLAG